MSTSTAAASMRRSLSARLASGSAIARRGVMRQMAEDVLHHDDGPSTMMPRSMAPIESRLADSPRSTVMMTASEQRDRNGGRDDDRRAQIAQEQPLDQEDQRNAEHHVVQHRVHGDRRRDRRDRRTASICTPFGSVPSVLSFATASRTRVTTSMVRSNFCISTMPLTTSVLSSRPAMPSRGRKPTWIFAISDSSTGRPPCCVSTMLSMSLTEVRTPRPRTLTDCSPSEIVRPPTLALLAPRSR